MPDDRPEPGDRPRPADGVPTAVVEALDGLDAATLRDVAAYAEALAAHEAATTGADTDPADDAADVEEPPEDWDDEEWTEAVADADAPPKATLTVKTINDNDYYYYQWREGDRIRSAYVAPVSPDR